MRIIAITIAVCILLAVAAPAAAQLEDPFNPQQKKPKPQKKQAEKPKDPKQILASLPFEVRQVDELPADLRGAAAIVPIGRENYGYSGAVYVPSYYDPGRTWPVLVDGQYKRYYPRSLKQFHAEAEKHGFILVVVEYLYWRGEESERSRVWSREGGATVTKWKRAMVDSVADMKEDEKSILSLLKEVGSKYNVEHEAVATTGFLGASVMSYRMVCEHPKIFCAAIARSGNFHEAFLPKDFIRARKRHIFVILGEKETKTLEGSNAAIEFFTKNKFPNLQVEKIPNSGVDSRPDIAANYFFGSLDQILGEEKIQLYRVHKRAMQCLADKKADAPRQKTNEKPPADKPKNPAAAAAALERFTDQYPKSPQGPLCEFLAARLAFEKLDDARGAEKILRGFLDLPLFSSPLAPRAILYLAEKIIDHDADTQEAIRVLGKITNRRDARAEVTSRAKELRKQLIQKRKQKAG